MSNKKIAVLLAIYNGEKFLSRFLESLLTQSFKDFVLFIRDDGSSDGSLDIAKSYSNDLNIIFSSSKGRLGAAKNFIQLLSESGNGFDCYMFADQDDVWMHDKIERAFSIISAENNFIPMLYCAGLEIVDCNLTHISYSAPPRMIGLNNALVENVATGCTIALNEKARELILRRLPEKFTMHDWWFYIVLSAFGRVFYDDYVSLKYRQHDSNAVGVASGVVNDFIRRLNRFIFFGGEGVFCIADQAAEFRRCYGHLLSERDSKYVEMIILGKKSLINRLILVFASNFVRQRYLDTFILRMLFLIGRY